MAFIYLPTKTTKHCKCFKKSHVLRLLQVSQALRDGRVSATELCRTCINQIQRTRYLNAFITITEETAMEQAQRADNRLRTGVCVTLNVQIFHG